ncbi:MAG: alpha-E domain-containing protein [Verrucomicrobiae bacterium]|nr:alpha-E domain-containing protein [Verrucomicrobiae bacterium]
MLSRVADNLYWMARYIERAENVARLIDVSLQILLDLPQREAQQLRKNWQPLLVCLDLKNEFCKHHRAYDSRTVTEFLVTEATNPYSLFNQLKSARENARAIREEISNEMWEQINRTFLWSISRQAHQLLSKNPYEFFNRIKQDSHLFQGITDATMAHHEGWHFIQIGKYLERAEKTSRFLDNPLLQSLDPLFSWVAILQSCSAKQAYQKRYRVTPQPEKVIEFLFHDPFFPRSITYCAKQIEFFLNQIAQSHQTLYHLLPPYKAWKILWNTLAKTPKNFSKANVLHQIVDRIQLNLNTLDEAIFKTYLCYHLNQAIPQLEQ